MLQWYCAWTDRCEHRLPMAPRTTYTMPIDRCDVEDKRKLEAYRAKRIEWVDWLVGDDEHCISNQLVGMCWNYITFRVINEAARLANQRKYRSAIRNRVLFEHLLDGFVASQALAIRRLTDEGKGVISAQRLVNDIYKQRQLLTREIFVGYDGTPYDPRPVRDTFMATLIERRLATAPSEFVAGSIPTSGPEAWFSAERRHRMFDRMAGTGSAERKRSDQLPILLFESLKQSMKERPIDQITYVANKCIAHAADLFSRSLKSLPLDAIAFRDIDNAHRQLISVSNFVSACLLYETHLIPVPRPVFKVFEYVDEAGFDEQDLRRLRRLAGGLLKRRERWADEAAHRVLSGR